MSPNFGGACFHVKAAIQASPVVAHFAALLSSGGNIIIECGKQLKGKINSKIPVFGPWMGLANPTVIELMARVGLDFLLLDGLEGRETSPAWSKS